MRSNHPNFDLGRITITLFILVVSVALIDCNSALSAFAYARILLAPKVFGSSNNIPPGPENGIIKSFSDSHSGPIFQQRHDQLEFPQPNSPAGPSSLSLLSELPTTMQQLPTGSFSSASSSITNQVLPAKQLPSLQQ